MIFSNKAKKSLFWVENKQPLPQRKLFSEEDTNKLMLNGPSQPDFFSEPQTDNNISALPEQREPTNKGVFLSIPNGDGVTPTKNQEEDTTNVNSDLVPKAPPYRDSIFLSDLPQPLTDPKESPPIATKTYKYYREKFAIRIISPWNIDGFSNQTQQSDVSSFSSSPPRGSPQAELRSAESLSVEKKKTYLSPIQTVESADREDQEEEEEDRDTKRERLQKIFRKYLAVAYFLGSLVALKNHIKVHGPRRVVRYLEKRQTKKIIEQKRGFLPLMPSDAIRVLWNIILVILLSSSGILTPYMVSFVDDEDTTFDVLDYLFTAGFGIDILINFISAYYSPSDGLVTDLKKISKHYLKTWFLMDLVLVLPIDSFIDLSPNTSGAYAKRLKKLLRLTRVPRIYRVLKFLRLFKVMKLFITNRTINGMIKQMSLNIGLIKMIQVLGNLLFLNHIASCLWFLSARLADFSAETWVSRSNLKGEDPLTQYIAAYYWAFQTLTTVGYGDIDAGTVVERILAILWMIVGVCMYSFAIGNLSTILQSLDRKSSVLRNKTTAFNNFAAKVKLPEYLRLKVQRFFELNHKENSYYWIEPQELTTHLPHGLKQSLLLYTYFPMIKSIKLLQMDANFTASLSTHLKLLKLAKNEILYREEDPSQEIYFISKGLVKFVTESGDGIFSLLEGTHFGEIEIFDDVKRISFCQAVESTLLIVCSRTAFMNTLQKYPDIEAYLRKNANIRKEKLMSKLDESLKRSVSIPKQKDDSASDTSQKKLLKSTDYFRSIVTHTVDKRRGKRFSALGGQNPLVPDVLNTKRISEISGISVIPSKITKSRFANPSPPKIEEVEKEKAVNSLGEIDGKSKPESILTSINLKRKGSEGQLFKTQRKFMSRNPEISVDTKLRGQELVPSQVKTRLTTIIQEQDLASGVDSSFASSTSLQSKSSVAYTSVGEQNFNNNNNKMRPQVKRFSKLLQALKPVEELGESKVIETDQNIVKLDDSFEQKRTLIKSVGDNYTKMTTLKEKLDNLYTHFDEKQGIIAKDFGSIAQRQKDLDEMVERLFVLKN